MKIAHQQPPSLACPLPSPHLHPSSNPLLPLIQPPIHLRIRDLRSLTAAPPVLTRRGRRAGQASITSCKAASQVRSCVYAFTRWRVGAIARFCVSSYLPLFMLVVMTSRQAVSQARDRGSFTPARACRVTSVLDPNSNPNPYPTVALADKLVLGLPWYGYRYECLGAATDQDDTCNIAQVPFR